MQRTEPSASVSSSPTFDLQSHSTWSDGALGPAEVVARAARAGVELFALTDHDSVDGVAEAQEEARRCGIGLVPAVEISCLDRDGNDLHLLGYGIDHEHEELREALALYRGDRARRADLMAAGLRNAGFEIDTGSLEARRKLGLTVGRPHLAAAAFEHPANRALLQERGLRSSTDVLVAYLTPGKPAFRMRTHPTVREAIGLVKAAGGFAVWAHPYWDFDQHDAVESTLRRFAELGVDGVEAFYVEHDREQTERLVTLADELDLLTTGSADFHAPDHKHFSRFRAFDLYGLEPRLGQLERYAVR